MIEPKFNKLSKSELITYKSILNIAIRMYADPPYDRDDLKRIYILQKRKKRAADEIKKR